SFPFPNTSFISEWNQLQKLGCNAELILHEFIEKLLEDLDYTLCGMREINLMFMLFLLLLHIMLFNLKDFDDSLLQRINEVAHEDDIKDILPPDVSNYLISEYSSLCATFFNLCLATGLLLFWAYLKIAMFDKNGDVQALIQYPDVRIAVVAISYARHTDLSIKQLSNDNVAAVVAPSVSIPEAHSGSLIGLHIEEDKLRGRPSYEHLNKQFHILIKADLPPSVNYRLHSLLVASFDFKKVKLAINVTSFHGWFLVVQLFLAVGVIAFAAWGLGPLSRAYGILFNQKNDNSWTKSKEHQVMTSYIQPLLLWGGVVLICSVLNQLSYLLYQAKLSSNGF
ncbi:hypothetical protein Tco_1076472, partial [Tanacetum coccineum]